MNTTGHDTVLASPIRTITVGSGITPDLLDPACIAGARGLSFSGITAGGESHPALRTYYTNHQWSCNIL